jgi:hypothetical protein
VTGIELQVQVTSTRPRANDGGPDMMMPGSGPSH